MDSGFSEGANFDLDDIRKLQITYSRSKPGAGGCVVEYAGGRIEVFEVDRFLIARLLEQLERRDT